MWDIQKRNITKCESADKYNIRKTSNERISKMLIDRILWERNTSELCAKVKSETMFYNNKYAVKHVSLYDKFMNYNFCVETLSCDRKTERFDSAICIIKTVYVICIHAQISSVLFSFCISFPADSLYFSSGHLIYIECREWTLVLTTFDYTQNKFNLHDLILLWPFRTTIH